MWRLIHLNFARLGLQRRIMLYVSAGLVVFSAIYAVAALYTIQQSSDLVFRERLLVARTLAREVDDSLFHLEGDLADTGAEIAPALAANQSAVARASLRTLYDHWTLYHHFDSSSHLTLADMRGVILWTEPYDPEEIGHTLAPLPPASQASITTTLSSADAGTFVTLVVPLQSQQQTRGFIVGQIDVESLGATLEPDLNIAEPGYQVELIDSTGLIIASNERAKQFAQSDHRQLVAELLRTDNSGVRTHTIEVNGTESDHVVAFAPLAQLPWGIIVEQEVDQAFILPHHLQVAFIGFGILALLGGLVLAWLTTRTVVHPVNALIHATQEIAHGDLEHALDISGTDEVGTLARSFDDMRIELKDSRQEIARWNRELEARVEQRTRELRALVESSHALTSTLELDALFEILMRRTNEILPAAEGVALFLLAPDTQHLVVRSTFGFNAAACADLHFDLSEAIGGQVFQSQAPVLLKTVEQVRVSQTNLSAENLAHFIQAVGEREVKSALGMPLVSKGVCLGALVLYDFTQEAAFAESDVPVLQALADQAAAVIENARLYQEAREVGALRELNRLKSEFVARASHELRTPLTAIKSLAETLLRPDLGLDAATQREFLGGIDSASDRLNEIVKQLLMLSRVEAGKLEIKCEPVDVNTVIARVVARFRIQSPNRVIDVLVAPHLPPIQGDTERVEDVLTNLVSNAFKYSAADTPVRISAKTYDHALEVAVADAGMGIPLVAREKIFERFYRVDNAVTRRIGGAGLGLHFCKTYVEAMGGAIHVESEEGQGSVFSFSLPQAHS